MLQRRAAGLGTGWCGCLVAARAPLVCACPTNDILSLAGHWMQLWLCANLKPTASPNSAFVGDLCCPSQLRWSLNL